MECSRQPVVLSLNSLHMYLSRVQGTTEMPNCLMMLVSGYSTVLISHLLDFQIT